MSASSLTAAVPFSKRIPRDDTPPAMAALAAVVNPQDPSGEQALLFYSNSDLNPGVYQDDLSTTSPHRAWASPTDSAYGIIRNPSTLATVTYGYLTNVYGIAQYPDPANPKFPITTLYQFSPFYATQTMVSGSVIADAGSVAACASDQEVWVYHLVQNPENAKQSLIYVLNLPSGTAMDTEMSTQLASHTSLAAVYNGLAAAPTPYVVFQDINNVLTVANMIGNTQTQLDVISDRSPLAACMLLDKQGKATQNMCVYFVSTQYKGALSRAVGPFENLVESKLKGAPLPAQYGQITAVANKDGSTALYYVSITNEIVRWVDHPQVGREDDEY